MKQSHQLKLELAAAGDAAPIALMSRELIETGLPWSWTPQRVTRALHDRDTVVLAAREGECLAGFSIMQFDEERAHLSLLAVHPGYQRQGVARRMMLWLIDSALIAGIATIHLELRENNRGARRFYLAQGFDETARMPGYYRGVETAVRMLRNIRNRR